MEDFNFIEDLVLVDEKNKLTKSIKAIADHLREEGFDDFDIEGYLNQLIIKMMYKS